ncbi:hypothetical protein D3C87_1916790 [compost metagenome]
MQQHQQRMAGRSLAGFCEQRLLLPTSQGFEDMFDCLYQYRSVADQLVATPGAGVMNRPGNRVNLTPLFRREPRRD